MNRPKQITGGHQGPGLMSYTRQESPGKALDQQVQNSSAGKVRGLTKDQVANTGEQHRPEHQKVPRNLAFTLRVKWESLQEVELRIDISSVSTTLF